MTTWIREVMRPMRCAVGKYSARITVSFSVLLNGLLADSASASRLLVCSSRFWTARVCIARPPFCPPSLLKRPPGDLAGGHADDQGDDQRVFFESGLVGPIGVQQPG